VIGVFVLVAWTTRPSCTAIRQVEGQKTGEANWYGTSRVARDSAPAWSPRAFLTGGRHPCANGLLGSIFLFSGEASQIRDLVMTGALR
jgi:hypothetical protein